MKRLVFCLFMALALLLTACGGQQATEAPEVPATEEVQVTEEPAVEEEPGAMDKTELRFTYYADGNEAEVMQPILDKFMAENPDITVVLDVVPYCDHRRAAARPGGDRRRARPGPHHQLWRLPGQAAGPAALPGRSGLL